MKELLGLVGGVVAGIAAMMLVGWFGGMVFAVEGPAAPAASEAFTDALGSAPLGTHVMILISWFAAAFAAAATAKAISRVSWPGWTLAGLFSLVLAGTFLVPLPTWMQILAVAAPLVAGVLADVLIRGRPKTAATEVDAQVG